MRLKTYKIEKDRGGYYVLGDRDMLTVNFVEYEDGSAGFDKPERLPEEVVRQITKEGEREEVEVKVYDVQDLIDKGYHLEPIECRNCGGVNVVYNQKLLDGSCQDCGVYQRKQSEKKAHKEHRVHK